MKKVNDLENLAKKYRRDLFEKLLVLKQGHPGSIFSMMDIVVALYHGGFVTYDSKEKLFLDRVLISKGHATAALYPIIRDFGILPKKEWDNWGHKNLCYVFLVILQYQVLMLLLVLLVIVLVLALVWL